MTPLIRLVARIVAAVALLIAPAHLLRAESGPGDGFTAGIIAALALTLVYETMAPEHFSARLKAPRFERILAAGLGIVATGALMPLLAGENLLAKVEWAVEMPLVGSLELSQAKVFEIGLAVAVFGGSMLAIRSLGGRDEPERQGTEEEV
jgi:multisubunit Na+/H+ antiporter MnhB subunit